MDKNIFNYSAMKTFAIRMKDKNLENMSLRISDLSEEIKISILDYLNTDQS